MTIQTVLADPPWNESGGGKIKRGADRHYPLMRTPAIIELMQKTLADYETTQAETGHLWLWVTNNFLRDGLRTMDALSYRYVSNVAWIKSTPVELGAWKPQRFGLGQYLRGGHELLLFGVRGKTSLPRHRGMKAPPTVLFAPRREHSQKPLEQYALIERVSPGAYLELFARAPRKGWACWGNEV